MTDILTVYVDFHHEFFHKDLKRPHINFKLAFLNAVVTLSAFVCTSIQNTFLLLGTPAWSSKETFQVERQYGSIVRKPKEILNDV